MSDTDKPVNGLTGNGSAENPADLAGAYALHALSAAETAEYERYLEHSEQARIEAAELSDTAVALGLATAPVQPSSGLKASLMAQIASTPQLAPLPSSAATSAPAVAPAPAPAPTAVPATTPETAPSSAAGGPAAERAQRRWFQRPAGFLVAAAAAVALFVGGTFAGQAIYGGPSDDQFAQEQADGLAEINAAADTQRASTETVDGQKTTLVWSGELGLSAIIVDDLPALADDQDYQLWYIGEGGPVPAGTFDSTGSGTVFRVLDGTMSAGDAVGVTVEPAGGSDKPTTDPIVAIQS